MVFFDLVATFRTSTLGPSRPIKAIFSNKRKGNRAACLGSLLGLTPSACALASMHPAQQPCGARNRGGRPERRGWECGASLQRCESRAPAGGQGGQGPVVGSLRGPPLVWREWDEAPVPGHGVSLGLSQPSVQLSGRLPGVLSVREAEHRLVKRGPGAQAPRGQGPTGAG